jgi:hypothetical protein
VGEISTMANPGSPALERLVGMVGAWDVELRFPGQATAPITRASFEWIEDGGFLLYRLGARAGGLPHAVFLIGGDDSSEVYTALYADDRGVSRVYQMRLDGPEWTMWREAPGFSQRFTGRFSDDGRTIWAKWERSDDGTTWEHDFDMTYRRVQEAR